VVKLGTKVKTLHKIYVGRHKDQASNLTLLPVGTVGEVKFVNIVPDDEYYLVRFTLDGDRFWVKVNPYTTVSPV